MRTKELVVAKDAYEKGLAKADDQGLHEKLQHKLGWILFKQGKYAEAIPIFEAQVQKHSSGVLLGPGLFLTAESLYRQNTFDKSFPLFEKVISLNVPNNRVQALYRAGDVAGKLNNWPVSQKYFTQLVSEFPKFNLIDDARYGIGVALERQNKKTEARAAYSLLKEGNSEASAKAWFMLGEMAFNEKKYEEAVEHFLYITVNYGYKEWKALAYFEAGRCFGELDKKEEAVKALSTFVKQFPDHEKVKNAAELIAKFKT